MIITQRALGGVYSIAEEWAYQDERGSLKRLFDAELFDRNGLGRPVWVQETYSYTAKVNVLRGIHVQLPPFTEAKLITVLSGEMFWVVVDLRQGSKTFGQWDGIMLTPDGIGGLYVERGLGHGCLSLTKDCVLLINSDNFYSREHGRGIAWDDEELGIQWPLLKDDPIISEEHRAYPDFSLFKNLHKGL